MSRRIVITSGKGGVGKTTVTAFLGAKLSEAGERVALLDLDLGLNNLDVTMGIEDKTVYDVTDVVEGRCRPKQALIQCGQKNLFVLPSSHTFSKQVTSQGVKLLIEGLSSCFDYVLIDCPAGIDMGFHRAIGAATEAIVVVTPTPQSLRDADKVLTILKSYRLDGIGAVVNRTRTDLIKKGIQLSDKEIERMLKIPVYSTLPESDDVLLAKNYNLSNFSNAGKALKKLSEKIRMNKSNVGNYNAIYNGLFGSKTR